MEEEIVIDTKTWTAPEYIHKPRSNDWCWGVGIIAVLGAIAAIWFGSYIFAIFILLSATVLIMITVRPPNDITIEVNPEGIKTAHVLIPYKKIKGFSIKNDSPYAKLLLDIDKNFLPLHSILLPEEMASEVSDELKKVIPVVDLKETQLMEFAEKIGM